MIYHIQSRDQLGEKRVYEHEARTAADAQSIHKTLYPERTMLKCWSGIPPEFQDRVPSHMRGYTEYEVSALQDIPDTVKRLSRKEIEEQTATFGFYEEVSCGQV